MKLTRYTDYSLRVLMHLALNRARLCSISEIAKRNLISENHLTKVVHHLGSSDTSPPCADAAAVSGWRGLRRKFP
jgi:DNA-binding IscR family transcriptional regulator